MPQDACHTKSSTKLLQLNNSIVLAHIADSKRHDPDDSNIIQEFTLDLLAFPGNDHRDLAPINFHDRRKVLINPILLGWRPHQGS